MSLLDKARKVKGRPRRSVDFNVDETELAIAVIMEQVTTGQAVEAIGKTHNGSIQTWTVSRLKAAYRANRLLIEIVGEED